MIHRATSVPMFKILYAAHEAFHKYFLARKICSNVLSSLQHFGFQLSRTFCNSPNRSCWIGTSVPFQKLSPVYTSLPPTHSLILQQRRAIYKSFPKLYREKYQLFSSAKRLLIIVAFFKFKKNFHSFYISTTGPPPIPPPTPPPTSPR